MDEFETSFKNSYWRETIKDEYEKKLQFARYKFNDNKSTCVQYAMHMAAIAADLGYNEKQSVVKISKLYNVRVKDCISNAPEKTLT